MKDPQILMIYMYKGDEGIKYVGKRSKKECFEK